MVIEHDESVIMLEGPPRPRRRPRHGNIERRLHDRFERSQRDLGYGFGCHVTPSPAATDLRNPTVRWIRHSLHMPRIRCEGQTRTEQNFASVLSLLTFANRPAATRYECQNKQHELHIRPHAWQGGSFPELSARDRVPALASDDRAIRLR